MEKERRQPKREEIVPLEYRVLIAIWLISFGLVAYFAYISSLKQKNPGPLLQTLAIGTFAGIIIITAGIIAEHRRAKRSS